GKDLSGFSVFIIDTIGLLSKIYSYADIAYVGGAMGHTGLHNILEPAVFGVPIVIGKNHKKFPEAQKMINQAGVQSVTGQEDLDKTLSALIASLELRQKLGRQNGSFIEKNKGALIQIIQIIRIYL
ncbi:MAG TPA: 3-deoxy-D-manno-octulosonic acid transferase, partial [Aquaticitalea sp.]|nr:3-deoxy-D-manno-octulosonic acid transferase [Aquaticitalea sp.]